MAVDEATVLATSLAPGGRPFGAWLCESVLGDQLPGTDSRPGHRVRSERETLCTGYVDALRFAHAASLTVDVTLFNGRTFFAGVQAIDEDYGTVTLYAPMAFKDSASQRIAISEIVSVAVTEIEWHPPNEIG